VSLTGTMATLSVGRLWVLLACRRCRQQSNTAESSVPPLTRQVLMRGVLIFGE
jgi:hypothetical protein